jgi:aminoglycoside phosphotransferase (APT) family kinase protein
MSSGKMHANEVETNIYLVNHLLQTQFPQWADLSIEPIRSSGTDNAIYRLGANMLVRLPRIQSATTQVDKEQEWLPKLAPYLLPFAIPVPLAKGAPDEAYPWHWSIYQWLEGETATIERVSDPNQIALELAQFITALHRIDTSAGGLPPGPHNSFRGVPLAERDQETRTAIAELQDSTTPLLTTDEALLATTIWEAALQAPSWNELPVWIHGDLQPGNLLIQQGRLSAVIDFGCLGVGDPACDLIVAWNLLTAESRTIFCTALGMDNAMWERGRGWALSIALIALPYYQYTNPILADISRLVIAETLADYMHQ